MQTFNRHKISTCTQAYWQPAYLDSLVDPATRNRQLVSYLLSFFFLLPHSTIELIRSKFQETPTSGKKGNKDGGKSRKKIELSLICKIDGMREYVPEENLLRNRQKKAYDVSMELTNLALFSVSADVWS